MSALKSWLCCGIVPTAECFQRIFDQHKTPEEKARIPKPARLAAARFASSQAQGEGSDEEGGEGGDLGSLVRHAGQTDKENTLLHAAPPLVSA
jgi:hypothetical protein